MISLLSRRLRSIKIPVVSVTNEQQKALDRFRKKLATNVYTFEKVPCLCGNYDGWLIAQFDRYALEVNTYLCKSCGIMWTSPRMTDESLVRFYEEDYRSIYVGEPQAPDEFFAAQIQHGKIIYEFVAPVFECHESPTVFDVGCGAGGTLVPFVEVGCPALGCDLGHDYLERGRAAGLHLIHGDVTSLSAEGPANLIILSHVLEHLSHPLRTIKQIADMLTDDGYVYVELPGILNIHKTYGDLLLFFQNAHLYHFTLTTLTNLMAQAGFKLVKGDEYIRALFQRDSNARRISTKKEYYKVLVYLLDIELERISSQLRFNWPMQRIIRKIANLVLRNSFVIT